jgi:signal transduction histidine kinase
MDALAESLHELNNHVHAIAMGVQMILDEADGLPEHQRDFLRAIDGRCDELVRLMRGLASRASATARRRSQTGRHVTR